MNKNKLQIYGKGRLWKETLFILLSFGSTSRFTNSAERKRSISAWVCSEVNLVYISPIFYTHYQATRSLSTPDYDFHYINLIQVGHDDMFSYFYLKGSVIKPKDEELQKEISCAKKDDIKGTESIWIYTMITFICLVFWFWLRYFSFKVRCKRALHAQLYLKV